MGIGRKSNGMELSVAQAIVDMFRGGELRIFDNSASPPATSSAAETGVLLMKVTLSGATHTAGSLTNGLVFECKAGSTDTIQKVSAADWRGKWLEDGLTPSHYRFYDKNVTTGASNSAIRFDGDISSILMDIETSVVNRELIFSSFEVKI